ncbi:HAD family hydrolase [Actinacidiphila glaucinigra]|uniref:HAD family hydrolase n=1 Tax=Actinacidiphila glaucinigra TaxID=235986 RepID=UPI002DDB0C27|nr:HAD family hydrolase [Actinacidiphila glaucinigra]WSD60582.1 HAD family hydrolase [Actinacidiphila glaucinigra]
MTNSGCAVLFDLDGVLLDSRRAMRQAILDVARAALGEHVDESRLPAGLDHLPHHQHLARLGVTDEATVFGAAWEDALALATWGASPFPGAAGVLRDLAASGTAIGVVTMQPASRVARLVPAELSAHFGAVVGWGDAAPKPSGEGILLALDRLGVPPGRACFVGDSPSDVAAAAAAGVPSIGAVWGYTGPALESCGPTALAGALTDVPGVVGSLLGPA